MTPWRATPVGKWWRTAAAVSLIGMIAFLSDRFYAAYDQFLDELKNGSDFRHRAARQRFIDRVQHLPDRK